MTERSEVHEHSGPVATTWRCGDRCARRVQPVTGRPRRLRAAVLAATAELGQFTLLHVDKDFELIADLTGQAVERLTLP